MKTVEFLALRKLQLDHKASDHEIAQFLDLVSAGNSDSEAMLDLAMIEVADESYEPDGTPPLPSWCRSGAST